MGLALLRQRDYNTRRLVKKRTGQTVVRSPMDARRRDGCVWEKAVVADGPAIGQAFEMGAGPVSPASAQDDAFHEPIGAVSPAVVSGGDERRRTVSLPVSWKLFGVCEAVCWGRAWRTWRRWGR